MEQIIYAARALVVWTIKIYQYLLSPYLGPCCRFYPCCSNYALQAVKHYGVFKGTWFAIKRIIRCHPWALGGYDPVCPNSNINLTD